MPIVAQRPDSAFSHDERCRHVVLQQVGEWRSNDAERLQIRAGAESEEGKTTDVLYDEGC